MKAHKKLLILIIVVINCIQLIVCNAQISNNEKIKDRLETIKEKGY